jgi:hypothetical protein
MRPGIQLFNFLVVISGSTSFPAHLESAETLDLGFSLGAQDRWHESVRATVPGSMDSSSSYHIPGTLSYYHTNLSHITLRRKYITCDHFDCNRSPSTVRRRNSSISDLVGDPREFPLWQQEKVIQSRHPTTHQALQKPSLHRNLNMPRCLACIGPVGTRQLRLILEIF